MKKINILFCAGLIFTQLSFASYQERPSDKAGQCLNLYSSLIVASAICWGIIKVAQETGYSEGYQASLSDNTCKIYQRELFDRYHNQLRGYDGFSSSDVGYSYHSLEDMIKHLAVKHVLYTVREKEDEQNRQKRNDKLSKSKQYPKHFTNKQSKCFSRKHSKCFSR